MPPPQPYPELNGLITPIGDAGRRIAGMDASEGGAGNISICVSWNIEVRRRFPLAEDFTLPQAPTASPRVCAPRHAGCSSGLPASSTATSPCTMTR